MQRVAVLGCAGAGKTTLALEMGKALALPVVHLDGLYWRSGWVETPAEEWREIVAQIVRGERWIIDGNYGGTLDARLAAADTAVFLDFPTSLCLRRIVVRRIRYRGRSRPDMAPGCPEKIDWEFVAWVATFRRKSRPHVLESLAKHEHLRVVTLRNPHEVARFVEGLRGSS
jgi:adenylate kinase family enzyme